MAYDQSGRLAELVDANGNTTSYSHDQAGQLTGVVDGTGATWQYGYDQLGDVSSVVDPLGNQTSFTYDQVGNLTSVTDPSGQVQQWQYDPAGRLAATVKPGGSRVNYDYDQIDNLVKVSYPAAPSQNVAYTFDGAGNRASMTDSTGKTVYIRDELGRLSSVTQGDGRGLVYSYTPDGQIATITYPDASVVKYGYDQAGNLVSVTDQNGTATYIYQDDRVVSLQRPGGWVTAYGYDQAGQVAAVVNCDGDGVVVSRFDYVYDQAGQVSAETQTSTLDKQTWSQISRTFTYDETNRLATWAQTVLEDVGQPDSDPATPVGSTAGVILPGFIGGPSLLIPTSQVITTAYTYDGAGNRVAAVVSTPGDVTQESIAYTYNANNQLVHADSSLNGVTDYTWSPTGSLVSAVNTDTGVISYDWTVADRLKAVRQGGRLLMAASYDGDGNLVFQVTSRPVAAHGAYAATGGSIFTWTDDELAVSPAGLFWYGFTTQVAQAALGVDTGLSVAAMAAVHDGFGVVQVRVPGQSGLDQADVDALADAGVTPADVSDVVTSITTTLPDSKHVNVDAAGFTYDLAHHVNNVNTVNPQIMADYGPGGRLTANYTYGGGDLLAVNATGNSESTGWLTGLGSQAHAGSGWYLGDGRGNITQTATTSGEVIGQPSVDPWGASMGAGFGAPQFGYQQQLSDPGVGLQSLRARWYEPTSGRFISADPVMGQASNPLTLNRYTYAWSNPVNMSDPSGYWPAFLDKAVKAVTSAVSTAASWVNNNVIKPVVSAVKTAATWVNNNVVKPVVNAVKTAASWVNNNVVKPVVNAVKTAASWVNNKVVQPAKKAVTNAVNTVVNTAVNIAQQAKTAVGAMASAAVVAFRSTTAYIAQRTAEAKAAIEKFVCSTANKLSNAWEQYVPDSIKNLPWGTIGKVALMVGGAALTIATLGAAGPVVGAIMIASLVIDTAVEVNDIVAEFTGYNFIQDMVCSGSPACYAAIELGSAALSLVGPGGAAGATRAAEAVAEAERAAQAGIEAERATKAAVEAERAASGAAEASRTASTAAETSKVESSASSVGGSCLRSFTSATAVLMGDGSSKPIGDVRVGDQVTSYDPGSGLSSVQSVTATWPHQDMVVTLTFGDGSQVETTISHPWWDVTTRTYTRTDHLRSGDLVLTADGQTLTVQGMSAPQGDQLVFNLTVTGPHTYYVGDNHVLVHNCPSGEPTPNVSPTPKTNGQASALAAEMGFWKAAGQSNGQAVFTDGKIFISLDKDSHSGGVWKVARSAKDLLSKTTRTGTYDATLTTRIGD